MSETEVVTPEEPRLSKDPRLSELFDFIQVEEGVNVIPVTVKQDPNDTRLLLAIQGERDTASTIMAQLMSVINNMYDMAAQDDASNDDADEPQIIVP